MSKSLTPRFQLNLKSASAGATDPDIAKVQKYLTRFGYLTTTIDPGTLDPHTSKALKSFQTVQGLNATGRLDAATAAALEAARCGTPDVGLIAEVGGGTSASFVLRGCAYNATQFSYRFVNGTADVTANQERDAVRRAFATWAATLCGVTFVERTADPVDFEIGWFTGSHGDGSAFDGIGNTLAHAFFPPPCGGAHAGELHFDDDETWSLTGAGTSFDVETVALHEVGHLLGLDHSSVAGSVMFPSYGGVRRALTADDINGVRRLYPFLCRRSDSGSQAGFVAEIAAARHRQAQVVTAVRTQAGTLKLIAWTVAANGALKLISWSVSDSTIRRLADSGSQAGSARIVRAVRDPFGHILTAVKAANGSLKLITWNITATGTISRLSDSGDLAGETGGHDLSVAGGRVGTAVRTSAGNLQVILWQTAANGNIARVGDSAHLAGTASLITQCEELTGVPPIVTSVRTATNSLKLISWSTP